MRLQQILGVVLLVSGFSHLQAIPEKWPEHYHVGTIGSDLTIMCPLKAEKVKWMSPKRKAVSHQKTLHLTDLDYKKAGKYLCLVDDHNQSQRSSVYVLIQEPSHQPFKFEANSYSSPVLHCSIDEKFYFPVLVRAKAYRWKDSENSTWVQTLHKNAVKSTITFTIPISSAFCPHEEHANPFLVSVEMMTEEMEYRKLDKPISMADVVVPGAPENIIARGDWIHWTYPSSWPLPHSFYPLLFQVKASRRDTKKVTAILEATSYSKRDICTFQVRCRELYSLSSHWSPWSPTRNFCMGPTN
ncbi:interleukin-12 subunit beta-like [Lithobates pipiens]